MKKYKTIDLCAGIGGIRRGFELADGEFENICSAEIDSFACFTYEHLFGENPNNDVTSEGFKKKIKNLKYDVLLAGFPCQTFSRAGLEQGFKDSEKGNIFFHIAEIIKMTMPKAIFLENVDNLVTHDAGNTFKIIINCLENTLNYKIIGVTRDENGNLMYDAQNFIRNSKNFGLPQNRPRTYLMGFNRQIYGEIINEKELELPQYNKREIYKSFYDILETHVPLQFYLSEGYLNTLKAHRARQKNKGNGFGYKVLNDGKSKTLITNTLLATGGSGKERNLIIDYRDDIIGKMVPPKRSGINKDGIRTLTPGEWAKLQGFKNYAFFNKDGLDQFSFPSNVSITQQYKQLGNSVTIPVIETMAKYMLSILRELDELY